MLWWSYQLKLCYIFFSEKRYESEEKYSDDGSTIIVSDDEKYNVRQLNSKVDEFLTQKTVLLENLPKLMILADNLYDLKNKLHTKLLKVKCKCKYLIIFNACIIFVMS